MSDFKKSEKKRHKLGKSKNDKLNKKNQILHEIEELGGDAADYDLIAGIDSDQEETIQVQTQSNAPKGVKKAAKSDETLAKDLKKLAKELGLKTGKYLEEITVDDDALSLEGKDAPAREEETKVAESPEETRKREKRERKEKKQEKKRTKEAEDDGFKIHAKAPEPDHSRGHAHGEPMLQPTPLWHEINLDPLEGIPEDAPAEFIVNRQFSKAKDLLAAENELYASSAHVKSSDRQFLSTIMRSGTLNDRVSALTLVVQESPIHGMKSMDALLSMCKKKGRNEAVSSVGAIKDLMQGTILPGRKLKYFKDQAGVSAKDITDRHLILWAFEDYLKRYYFELLGVMEGLSLDPLPFPRNHMVRYFFELIKDKPEQEANLLRLLTNKLGDKDKMIAAKCSQFCLQLMQAHPAMKRIIVGQLEEVLFKPSTSSSAQYYVIITLNQTILSAKDTEIANHLIEVYLTFFTKIINESETSKPAKIQGKPEEKKNRKALKKEKAAEQTETAEEELNSKMISAVLTGVNRAFPFSKLDNDSFSKNLDTLYRVTHSSNFNTSIQALILIQQVANAKPETADRFYRTLYESINDPRLITSSKQALYLNLLFKSLKADRNTTRTKAFVKRLVQSATMHSPAFICALFFLFSELEMAVPAIRQLTAEIKKDIGNDQLLTPPSETADDVRDLSVAPAQEEEKPELPKPYDGRARDPRFSNTEDTSLWEAIPFLNHFHPSVSLFSRSWLLKEQMPSKPDLSLHTLTHFLDRFVYRNAKTKSTDKGGSIMQPLAGGDTRGMILQQSASNQQPVNSESFYKQSIKNVAADEMFFYNYFNEKMARQPKKSTKKSRKEGDEEADADGMNEDEVWQALVQSRPDVEAPSEGSDMSDLDDLEDAFTDSDDDDDEAAGFDQEEDVDDEVSADGAEHVEGQVEIPEFNESDFEAEENEFDEDEDDLLPSDQDEEESEFTDFDAPSKSDSKKRKSAPNDDDDDDEQPGDKNKEKEKKKKKKVKLPAFASAEDYMHLIDG